MRKIGKLFFLLMSTRFWVLMFTVLAILIAYIYGEEIPRDPYYYVILQLVVFVIPLSKVAFNSFEVENTDQFLKDVRRDHAMSNFTVLIFALLLKENQNYLSLVIILINYAICELDYHISVHGGAVKLREIDKIRLKNQKK